MPAVRFEYDFAVIVTLFRKEFCSQRSQTATLRGSYSLGHTLQEMQVAAGRKIGG